jgi:hypothetical protein
MKTYKIKSEDKAAFLNRMEKVKSPIDTTQIKDIPEEEAFEVTVMDSEQLRLVKTILGQAPKINVIKENISLLEIVKEAVADDVKKAAEANAIINWVEDKIKNYTKDTKEIEFYDKPYNKVILNYKGLKIIMVGGAASDRAKAKYDHTTNTIYVYETKIKAKDESTLFKSKFTINVSFSKKDLFHELIHYLDYTRQYKGGGEKIKAGDLTKQIRKIKGTEDKEKRWKAYVNFPMEMNTHFFERVFPGILEDIKNNRQLVTQPFSDFFKDILKDDSFSDFYNELNDKNRKKIQKRLGTLYLELKNDPDKIKELSKINIDNVENEKEKVGWLGKIWNKLSS